MDSELEMTDKAVAALNDRVSQIESRLNAYGVPEVRGEYTDRRPEMVGSTKRSATIEFSVNKLSPESWAAITGATDDAENLSELRAAYLELRRPPWNKHSEKMVRLYSAIEAVLGGPTAVPEEMAIGKHMSPDHNLFKCPHPLCVRDAAIAAKGGVVEKSTVGIDFGVGIAVYGGATEPDGVIIGRNSEEVECNNRHCEHQITGAFGGHCLRSTCDNWRHNCPRHQAIIGEG